MKYEVGDIVKVRENLRGYSQYGMSDADEDDGLLLTAEMLALRGCDVQIYQAIDEVDNEDDGDNWHRGYRVITQDGEMLTGCIWTDDMFSALVGKDITDDDIDPEELCALYEWA